MPLPSNAYYPMFPAQIQTIDSTTGLPLVAGTYSYYQDQNRTVPKDVYQRTENPDNTFTYTSLGSVLQLSAIGTFVDPVGNNIIPFLWPFKGLPSNIPPSNEIQLYYIVVESSGDTPEFTVSAWPPGVAGASPAGNDVIASANIVSNPQFAEVDFASPTTITLTGDATTEIAPDWSIITTGAGTVILNQTPDIDSGAPGGPAFGLQITSSGIANLTLSQRITMSPRILENGFASGTFICKSNNSVSSTITMNFVPSNPALSSQAICSTTAVIGSFNLASGTVNLAVLLAKNENPGDTGYVDVQLSIPTNTDVTVSCVQLISVPSADLVPAYIQESTPRQIDHLYHYWQPKLFFKPIPSLLTGWDFPLNPRQFGSTTTINTAPEYVWDQTICATAIDAFNITNDQDVFVATSTVDNDAFYMLQYLSTPESLGASISNLSVNLFAQSSIHSGVVAKVYLFSGNAGSTIPILPLELGNLKTVPSVDGTYTLTDSNWTLVAQSKAYASSTTLLQDTLVDFGFSGWNNLTNRDVIISFAIMVTFFVPTAGTQVIVNSISLVPGDIPTRPAPQTSSAVLQECEYYYSKSFNTNTLPVQAAGVDTGYITTFLTDSDSGGKTGPSVRYPVVMRTTPTVITYNPRTTNAFIDNVDANISFSSITLKNSTPKGFYVIGNYPGGGAQDNTIGVHYVADARLGVIT